MRHNDTKFAVNENIQEKIENIIAISAIIFISLLVSLYTLHSSAAVGQNGARGLSSITIQSINLWVGLVLSTG